MDELRKKLLKNIIMIAAVFVLVFIILIFYQGCSGKKISYAQVENKLVSAAKKYFEKTELYPINNGETVVVSSDVLISNGYLKKFEDLTDAKNCFGQVTVQKNGENYNYLPYLSCDNYKTETIQNTLTSKVVTEGDGLYYMNGEYIFRGEYPNNYVSFADRLWRIIGITNDGYLKLISAKAEEDPFLWDNRYNIDVDDYVGINEYELSRLKNRLSELYDKNLIIPNYAKSKLAARDICVGKRNINDLSMTSNKECNEKLLGQYIDLIGVTDTFKASIDPDCKDLKSRSCSNYNYFSTFFSKSWTTIGVEGNTSRVYMVSSSSISTYNASKEDKVFIVVYLNAMDKFKSGDGSQKSPYTI